MPDGHVAYTLVRVIEHPHSRRGRQSRVGCRPIPCLFVRVSAESLHQTRRRLRIIQGQLPHPWIRVAGVAQEAAGEIRVAVGAVGDAEASGPPLPRPKQHAGGYVIAGFGEEAAYDTVFVPGEEFDDVRREMPRPGNASVNERVGGGGQAHCAAFDRPRAGLRPSGLCRPGPDRPDRA